MKSKTLKAWAFILRHPRQALRIIKNHESVNDKTITLDYSYVPAYRKSLETSRVAKLLNDNYNSRENFYLEQLRVFSSYKEYFQQIPFEGKKQSIEPCWNNGYFPSLDAISLYSYLVMHKPRWYVEVGSGNSTKFAARAIRDHKLETKIISIDPYPRAEIDSICSNIFRCRLEDMNLDFFSELTNSDILFIDNSHRSFQNSDVTVFFTEILPELPSGILYGLHDICLPYDQKY
jgi:hypothetical protein